MERKSFMQGMVVLQAYYEPLPDNMLNLYYEHLKDLSEDQFNISIEYILKNYKYRKFPLIADFRQGIGDTEENRAIAAIGRLKLIARRGFSSDSVDLGDPVLHAVAKVFGSWETLVFWQSEDWNINYGRMIELYKVYSRSGQGAERIAGYNEIGGYEFKIIRYGEDNKMLPEPEPVKEIESKE